MTKISKLLLFGLLGLAKGESPNDTGGPSDGERIEEKPIGTF